MTCKWGGIDDRPHAVAGAEKVLLQLEAEELGQAGIGGDAVRNKDVEHLAPVVSDV